MEATAFERRPRLDQEHRLVGSVQEVRPKLVGETPARESTLISLPYPCMQNPNRLVGDFLGPVLAGAAG